MVSSGRILMSIIILLSLINSVHHSHARVNFLRPAAGGSSSTVDDDGHGRKRMTMMSDKAYCEGWKFTVETNDAGKWSTVPKRCVEYVTRYMEGKRYRSDSEVVAEFATTFAKSVNKSGGGKDAWVFDIDEIRSEPYDDESFTKWVKLSAAADLPASRRLYYELKKLNFTIFLITGRDESERNVTEKNLYNAGYKGWKNLILRGAGDQGKKATVYKSEKRSEIESAGYKIHGNSGDQWSDLTGFSVATRSFKLPNPMYYIA